MMTSYTSSCYPIAVQSVREAILKDSKGQTKEALCNYVSCMLFMLQALKNEAWERIDVNEVCSEDTNKLLKMSDQCLGRIKDILIVNKDKSIKNTRNSGGTSPAGSPNLSDRRRASESTHLPIPTNQLARANTLLSKLPSPPGTRKTNTTNFQNVNQERFQAYQRRKTLRGVKDINAKYNATNYNLHFFRKQAELKALSMAREKVAQKRWMERQNEIKLEAEKRFNLRNNRSQRDKEYRQDLLAEIIAYEEQTNWPVTYRDSLKKDALDIQAIINVVQAVLRCKDHPLCKVCKGLQYVVYQKVVEVLNKTDCTGKEYLTPVDSLRRHSPKIPLSSKISNTGCRDKRYSVCSVDENIMSEMSKGDPIQVNSGDSVSGNTSEASNLLKQKKSGDEAGSDVTDSSNGNDNHASVARQKFNSNKTDSFEKLYDDLEDAIFTSSDSEDESDDANDEAESSNKEATSSEPKDEDRDSDLNPTSEDSAQATSLKTDQENSDVEKNNSFLVLPGDDNNDKNEEKDVLEKRNEEPKNPVYSFKDRISLGDIIENKDTCKQINIDDHLYDIPCDANENQNVYETMWSETEAMEGVVKDSTKGKDVFDEHWDEIDAPVIQVNSPSTPQEECRCSTPPLPDRYSSEGEYSDIGEEFKEDTYEDLNPRGDIAGSRNRSKKVKSGSHDSLQSPDYYDLEADKSSSIGDDYEILSFDGTEENVYEELETLEKKTKKDDSHSSPICEHQQNRYRGTHDRFPIDTFYLKKLDGIIQEIRFGIDRLHSVLLLAYEDLDTPIGRDQSYATLESLLFQPLWGWLMQVFRHLNSPKETFLKDLMVEYQNCKPQDLKVRDKFALNDSDNPSHVPYEEAINEIKQIACLKCPLDKLECLVRMSKAICHCVDVYWAQKGGNSPSVGCDDLLPIVAYVIVKTNYPQLVSECHAMEEFIHEGYLMGEEGYCLTTLHAALTHLLTLSIDTSITQQDTRR